MSLLKRIGGGVPTPAEPAMPRAPIRPETTGRLPSVGVPGNDETFRELRSRVQDRLINELNPQIDLSNPAKVRKQVEEIFNAILDSESIVLSRSERQRLFESITADIIGLGPIEPLLADDEVSEIMVNGPKQVYVEKKGKLIKTDITFTDDEQGIL
jgi:Flp pilus assembly protein, ATPase CpaF